MLQTKISLESILRVDTYTNVEKTNQVNECVGMCLYLLLKLMELHSLHFSLSFFDEAPNHIYFQCKTEFFEFYSFLKLWHSL